MKPKVLSFGAHPDDIEIGCGGTEALLIKQGYEVIHVCATSGEAGSQSISKEMLGQIREDEARNAAEYVGVKEVIFLRYPDGLTSYNSDMKIEVIDVIREIRPEIIFVHASSDHFPDHAVIHQLVMGAIVGAQGPWYQESVATPHKPKAIYGYEVWHPLAQYQMVSDISETIETKVNALRCFSSQIKATNYDEAVKGLARYRAVMSFTGTYAEVFEVLFTSSHISGQGCLG